MKTVGIIGGGAWGSAIGKILAESGHKVDIWVLEKDVVKSINDQHENTRYLPGVSLPEGLKAWDSIDQVVGDKDFLIFSTPSLYLLDAVKRIITVPAIAE